MTWIESIARLHSGIDLEPHEVSSIMQTILEGRAEVSDIKEFLLALKKKGESADEVSALVAEMFRHSSPISITDRSVDTVGTGGDGAQTINISTTAAIIAASAGSRVVKHGNRAASSKSGSGDLLEALGVAITLDGPKVAQCVKELGIGFCFAPIFHPAMRYAAPARKELGVPTVFNILGPLANPAKPQAAAIGVADDRMHRVMAEVLATRGVDGFVFRGDDGLDEITLSTTTSVLTIGARITTAIFEGETGAPRDAVLLNAAAAIAAFDGETDLGIHERISTSLAKASSALDSGATRRLLTEWVSFSQSLV